MSRKVTAPDAGGTVIDKVRIQQGGTNAVTASEALANLGGVPASAINQPNGILGLNALKQADPSQIPTTDISFVSIKGPTQLQANIAGIYTITNYDSFITYNITPYSGAISRNGDTITYTPDNQIGNFGFSINGKLMQVEVLSNQPTQPTILSPINHSTEIVKNPILVSNPFSTPIGITDTHASSDWQVSTDSGFNTIVFTSVNDTINKVSIQLSDLEAGTTYYARVRYNGSIYGSSLWSDTLIFQTRNVFYPIAEMVKIISNSAMNYEKYGYSIAMSHDGKTYVVGAYGYNSSIGKVYVYVRSQLTWTLQTTIVNPDGSSDDQFGKSIALSPDGNTLVIGSPLHNTNTNTDQGAAYVYTHSGGVWTQQTKLIAPNGAGLDNFGQDVSISSNGAIIAVSSMKLNAANNKGSVYIFTRSGDVWTFLTQIIGGNNTATGAFGYAIDLNETGQYLAITDPFYDNNQGRCYLYKNTNDVWTYENIVSAPDIVNNSTFGHTVSISADGDTLLVGCDYIDSGKGAGYIFTRNVSAWTFQAKLIASDGLNNDLLTNINGASLSGNGDVAVLGSRITNTNKGGAYIYTRTGTTWAQVNKLTASDGASGDNFGVSVSLSKDGGICGIGSYSDTVSFTEQGAVYIFQ